MSPTSSSSARFALCSLCFVVALLFHGSVCVAGEVDEARIGSERAQDIIRGFVSQVLPDINMNAVDWSCATQVKRPRDMEQQLVEFRALLRHIDVTDPNATFKVSKHVILELREVLERMRIQVSADACEGNPVIARLLETLNSKHNSISSSVGVCEQHGTFNEHLQSVLVKASSALVKAIDDENFSAAGEEFGKLFNEADHV